MVRHLCLTSQRITINVLFLLDFEHVPQSPLFILPWPVLLNIHYQHSQTYKEWRWSLCRGWHQQWERKRQQGRRIGPGCPWSDRWGMLSIACYIRHSCNFLNYSFCHSLHFFGLPYFLTMCQSPENVTSYKFPWHVIYLYFLHVVIYLNSLPIPDFPKYNYVPTICQLPDHGTYHAFPGHVIYLYFLQYVIYLNLTPLHDIPNYHNNPFTVSTLICSLTQCT